MAKKYKDAKAVHDTGRPITTKSWFGSHKSMVVDTPNGVILNNGECVCRDDQGIYITQFKRLDNGLVDHNRQERRILN